jgi:hypothetical protein
MHEASELSRSILEFLSSSAVPTVRHCQQCGSLLEYLPATFYFAGKPWKIGLPVCTKCAPDSAELMEPRHTAYFMRDTPALP